MFADMANEFQNITKYDLLSYFTDYRDFMQNDYSYVYDYYAGNTETIDSERLNTLDDLQQRSTNLLRTFHTFAGKLGNVAYWELQSYCQDLNDTLQRISKLPKYCRTAKTYRGYKPYVQISGNIGGMKTVQDLATEIGSITETELILNNDLEEEDYEIDELKQISALVENTQSTGVVVSTILEQPVGDRIYGRDIMREITIEDNDLKRVEYQDNVEQKCDILLELTKGDVPEMPTFGKDLIIGKTYASFNYGEYVSDLINTFMQDDLFDSVEVTDLTFANGDVTATVDIKTKYIYSTTKTTSIYNDN